MGDTSSALYFYFFHFNTYTKEWNAVPRDKSIHYLNGTLKEGEVLKAKDIKDLVKYITLIEKATDNADNTSKKGL